MNVPVPLGRGLLAVTLLLAMASGCTRHYRPQEYVIATDRIGAFPMVGSVRVVGETAPPSDPTVFRNMGSSWETDYDAVTATLVAQLTKEITKRGGTVSDSASKVIRVTVLDLKARDAFMALEATMRTRLQIGDASPTLLEIDNKSPMNIFRALNGVIARTVIAILTNDDVQLYLGRAEEVEAVDASDEATSDPPGPAASDSLDSD